MERSSDVTPLIENAGSSLNFSGYHMVSDEIRQRYLYSSLTGAFICLIFLGIDIIDAIMLEEHKELNQYKVVDVIFVILDLTAAILHLGCWNYFRESLLYYSRSTSDIQRIFADTKSTVVAIMVPLLILSAGNLGTAAFRIFIIPEKADLLYILQWVEFSLSIILMGINFYLVKFGLMKAY